MSLDALSYVHGYDEAEATRLDDQADVLEAALHADVHYPEGSLVLEVGCGTGAQTVRLSRSSPHAQFVAFDKSSRSLEQAVNRAALAGVSNVRFVEADLFDLPFPLASFDHLFLCFVLEHLPDPAEALARLRRMLRPGGTITVIEGDHGSSLFHPDSAPAQLVIDALVTMQRSAGGDPNIGRRLYPLLTEAGLASINVQPIQIYADASRPDLADGFTRRTFTAMVDGVRGSVIDRALMTATAFDEGISALLEAAEPHGVFAYTFFRGFAREP